MRGLRAFGAALGAGKRLSIAACTYVLKCARIVPQSLSLQVLLLGLNAWLFYAGALHSYWTCFAQIT